MSADSDAYKIVQSLPGLSPAEQQYLMSVARGEGFYGLGWGNPSPKTIAESETLGIDPRAGVGSNNWGAIQGTGSAGSFPHVDHHADGKLYLGTFKKYSLPEEGASDLGRVLLKANVREALKDGRMRDAVYAQHDNHYFELNPEAYFSAVSNNYNTLTNSLKWAPALVSGGAPLPPLFSGQRSLPLGDSSSTEPSLHLGMQGEAVKAWQTILHLPLVDGKFGYATEAATRVWQKQFHLVPDGIVGPLTWGKAHGKI